MVHTVKSPSKPKTWVASLLVKDKGDIQSEHESVTLGEKSTKQDVIEAIRRNAKYFGKKVEVLAVELVRGWYGTQSNDA